MFAGVGWMAENWSEDPPRFDYDAIDRYERRELSVRLPDDEFGRVLNTFAVEGFQMRDAMSALLRSVERQQGAELVLRYAVSRADRKEAREHEAAQREAAYYNEDACATAIERLAHASTAVDMAWREYSANTLGPALRDAWTEAEAVGLPGVPLVGGVVATRERLRTFRRQLDDSILSYEVGEPGNVYLQNALDHHPLQEFEFPGRLLNRNWTRSLGELLPLIS